MIYTLSNIYDIRMQCPCMCVCVWCVCVCGSIRTCVPNIVAVRRSCRTKGGGVQTYRQTDTHKGTLQLNTVDRNEKLISHRQSSRLYHWKNESVCLRRGMLIKLQSKLHRPNSTMTIAGISTIHIQMRSM